MWHTGLILHTSKLIPIPILVQVRSSSWFCLEESTTELINRLSKLAGVRDSAAGVGSFAVRDKGCVGFEPFLAAWAAALVDGVDGFEMFLVLVGGVEIFAR